MVVSAWYGRAFAFAGALAMLVPSLAMWGFTVDDALIPLRYARHLYRFNPTGAATDGVTPLPWPFLVALLDHPDLTVSLERVKVASILITTAAGATLGRTVGVATVDRRSRLVAVAALLLLAMSFPVGAWSASGMETGTATALATLAALSFERPTRAAIFAGLAASLRPELIVWSLVVTAGANVRRVWIAFAPFLVCVIVRLVAFGRPAPLAILAKPSDFAHGLPYAAAGLVLTLLPLVLVTAPRAVLASSRRSKTLAGGLLAHVLVVIAVGGDWMPFARLLVPIVPSLVLVIVELGTLVRPALAIALGLVFVVRVAPTGRHVHADRKALIAAARPILASAGTVAALDVGWVGAAAPAATIVDLAGLTDPSIAVLSGGHTSKSVDLPMLLERHVDTIVLFSATRLVESRIARHPLFRERFELTMTLPLGTTAGSSYAFYRLRPASP